MDYWTKEMQKLADRCCDPNMENLVMHESVKIHLLHKFVDDCVVALKMVKSGTRWCKETRSMRWTLGWEEEDKRNNTPER